MSPLVLIVPSPAVGAPRVFQSFRAGIRWGVSSPLLDIPLSDDPSIVSDASSSNDKILSAQTQLSCTAWLKKERLPAEKPSEVPQQLGVSEGRGPG